MIRLRSAGSAATWATSAGDGSPSVKQRPRYFSAARSVLPITGLRVPSTSARASAGGKRDWLPDVGDEIEVAEPGGISFRATVTGLEKTKALPIRAPER